MLYPRRLTGSLAPFLKRREYLAIVGPRQAGKTTFLELLRKYLVKEQGVAEERIAVVTFEDRRLLAQFEQDPVQFVQSYMGEGARGGYYLMIDEFQYAQDGGQKLKLVYDTMDNIKIIITGSSSLDIKAKVGKFMVGRILDFKLYPFNFAEYLRARNSRLEKIYVQSHEKIIDWLIRGKSTGIKNGQDLFHEEFDQEYENYCIWGGYPAVVLAGSKAERYKILSGIFDNYILKDIKTLLELSTDRNLLLLSQYLATQAGNLVVYQNLSQASGLDFRKLKEHLNILEETFICRQVRPFFRNRQKELYRNPKIYFLDLGFRNNLMENMNRLDKRSDAGAVIENSVFIRLFQLWEGKINFWRTKAGAEVDFILQNGDEVVPVEVKYVNFASEKIPKGLQSFIDSFRPGKALIITRNFWGHAKRGKTKILFIPVYYL